MIRYAAPLLSLALLSACGDDPAPDTAAGAGAEGDVLEGSISDAMLPLDTLTSRSPPVATSSGGPSGADNAGSGAEGSDEDIGEAPADTETDTDSEAVMEQGGETE